MSLPPYFFWVYRDAAGEWRWRLISTGNRKRIAVSGEGFSSLAKCEENIALVKRVAPAAPVHYDVNARRR